MKSLKIFKRGKLSNMQFIVLGGKVCLTHLHWSQHISTSQLTSELNNVHPWFRLQPTIMHRLSVTLFHLSTSFLPFMIRSPSSIVQCHTLKCPNVNHFSCKSWLYPSSLRLFFLASKLSALVLPSACSNSFKSWWSSQVLWTFRIAPCIT